MALWTRVTSYSFLLNVNSPLSKEAIKDSISRLKVTKKDNYLVLVFRIEVDKRNQFSDWTPTKSPKLYLYMYTKSSVLLSTVIKNIANYFETDFDRILVFPVKKKLALLPNISIGRLFMAYGESFTLKMNVELLKYEFEEKLPELSLIQSILV